MSSSSSLTVLLEVDEFEWEVHIDSRKDSFVCIEQELGKLGKDVHLEVSVAEDGTEPNSEKKSTKEIYRLHRYSDRWKCYVDVMNASQIADGDSLIAVRRKDPSGHRGSAIEKSSVERKGSTSKVRIRVL